MLTILKKKNWKKKKKKTLKLKQKKKGYNTGIIKMIKKKSLQLKRKKKGYNTAASHVVSHHTTDAAQWCLTSQIETGCGTFIMIWS